MTSPKPSRPADAPVLFVLLATCLVFANAATPFTAGDKQAIVDRHNELRREQRASNMNYIDWDSALAQSAQRVADSCAFDHGNDGVRVGEFDSVGENIFAAGGDRSQPKTGLDATNKWYMDEVGNYDYDSNSCSGGECQHYTQVVWGASRKIGCGRTFCPTLSGAFDDAWFIVCQYGPAGNVVGERPFERGSSCTKCDSGSGQCFDGLCRPCSEHNEDCVCKAECENCGEVTRDCRCDCPNGFLGLDCSDVCEDTHEMCGANPGWPDASACSLGDFVPQGCPLMCGVCNARDQDFECNPSQSRGTGTGGTGSGGTGPRTTPKAPKRPKTPKETGNTRNVASGSGSKGGICTQQFTAATYVDDVLFLFHGGKLWRVSSSGELLSPEGGEDAGERFIKLPNDISAVYQRGDGNVVFLRGHKMFIFNDRKRIDGHPLKMTEWGLPVTIGAAVYNRQQDKTYFFKGPQVWRYDERSKTVDSGYPKTITNEFDDTLNKPTFAFSDSRDNYYFVKYGKVFKVSNGRKTLDHGYPKPFAQEFFSSCQ